MFLRPFKVGDFVTAGGVTGTVDTIGLFGTTINTPDNVRTIVGNNKIFSDTIQNFSANPYRRVDLTAMINNEVDHHDAIRIAQAASGDDPERARDACARRRRAAVHAGRPAALRAAVLRNAHYWQVYFDTNRAIREAFGEAGFPAPMPTYALRGMPLPG